MPSYNAHLETPRPVVTYSWRRGAYTHRDAGNLPHLVTYLLSLYNVTLRLEQFWVRAGQERACLHNCCARASRS